MFVIILTYKKPIEEIEKHLEAHIEFLKKHYAQNHFLASGRRNPRMGGVILSHIKDKNQLEKMLTEDPFHQYELADYEIIEFEASRFHPALGELLGK